MSTLTIPLSDAEIRYIEALKGLLGEKTSAGVIRAMIKGYESLNKENKEGWDRLRSKERDYIKLRDVARGYFHSMHDLMRESEFEQK